MNSVLEKLYPEAKIALHYGTDFELLAAVILSAQCTDKRVNQVTRSLFKKFRHIEDYARVSQRTLEREIFSCGFYRSKAKNIRGSAAAILSRHNGRVPASMHELVALPGVGRKTANVVLSTLHNAHEGIAVDTHVRRFALRFDLTDHNDPKRIEQDLMSFMPRSKWWSFNHRLVHYGRDYCGARKHDCGAHPLTRIYPKAATKWPRAR